MPLFPAFIDLRNKEILVVGGGKVATRKVEKLLPFGGNITVVAPRVSPKLKTLAKKGRIRLKRRRFLTGDLKGKTLVVVAVDDIKLQKKIFNLCTKRGILCNSVDNLEYCNFIFPALTLRGELVVGISTSGKAPALSKALREWIDKNLPKELNKVLNILHKERKSYPKGPKRQKYLTKLAKRLLEEALSKKAQ